MNTYDVHFFSEKGSVKIEEPDEFDHAINYDFKQESTLNGLCRACLCSDNLLDMMKINYHLEKPENYSEMLSYCYSIKLDDENERNLNLHLICSNCVIKLRDAFDFKIQLEAAEKTFKCLLDTKTVSKENEEYFDEKDSDDYNLDSDKYSLDANKNSRSNNSISNYRNKSTKSHTKMCKMKKRKKYSIVKKQEEKNCVNTPENFEKLEECVKSSFELMEEIEKIQNEDILQVATANIPYKLEKTDLQCKICDEVFPLNKNLKIHISVHYPNHVCHVCGRVFATQLQLYSHTNTHKPATLTCPLCPEMRFKSTASRTAHTRKKHLGDRNLYRCIDCNLRFSSYNARRRHFVAIHGENNRKYQCKNCPKRYGLRTHLNSHIRNTHLQVRNYVCETCGDGFYTKFMLKNHMLKHSGERNYQCSLCDKKYARKYTLTEHMKIHNNVKSHVCAVCGRAFTQKSTLKYHMKVHKESESKDVNVNSTNG